MRCQDAKQWLRQHTQCDSNLAPSDAQTLAEHLQACAACRTFEKRLHSLNALSCTSSSTAPKAITTERIMQAIEQQRRISQQLEDIHTQQQCRMKRIRSISVAWVALGMFTLSSIPLLFLAMIILRTDFVVKALYLLNGFIGIVIVLTQYLQVGLTLVTRNNWLLSGIAFAVVVMIGMWLRLMRPPQEA